MVAVLGHSKTKDAFLAACARNIWLLAAWYDLEIDYVHIKGKENVIADLLSRWKNTPTDVLRLHSHLADHLWLNVPSEFLDLDNDISLYIRYSNAALYFVEPVLEKLAVGVKRRLASALRPKTECYYTSLFRSFVAFCVKLNIFQFNVMHFILGF